MQKTKKIEGWLKINVRKKMKIYVGRALSMRKALRKLNGGKTIDLSEKERKFEIISSSRFLI